MSGVTGARAAPPRESRRGFILVSVLGALIVLTGLAAAVAYLVRTAVIGAAATRAELTIDALTRSGVEVAAYELFFLKRPAAVVNGRQIRMDDGVITLFVVDEAGKIDLNAATPEVLESLWRSIGEPGGITSESFAARVADYRDADGKAGEKGGAEAPDYAAAGPDRAPADAPFVAVDDLQNVLGVPIQAAQALAPLLTVHNPSGKVSVFSATPAVIRALPDGAGVLDKILAIRARPPTEEGMEAAQSALGEAGQNFSFERSSPAYTVRVEAQRGGARRATEMILVRARSGASLYYVTDRRRGR